jgi:hypothetical protein
VRARDRDPEFFDFAGAVLTRRPMDDVLEGLAGDEPVGAAFTEGGGKIPLEPERHRQFLGIVPIAAAHDPQHPQTRFAVAARSDSGHGRECTMTAARIRPTAFAPPI